MNNERLLQAISEMSTKRSEYNQNMYDCKNDKALCEVLEKIINFNEKPEPSGTSLPKCSKAS